MEGDLSSGLSNGNQVDSKILQTFQKSFVQVEDILDQNRLLINEINQNQESKIPDKLTRTVGLIKELNSNIRRVVGLYADLSSNFIKTMEPSSEGDNVAVDATSRYGIGWRSDSSGSPPSLIQPSKQATAGMSVKVRA
ncbi:hypothetical protein POTOM_059738 [Populus tomentosa]|uniref:Protein EARLY FLOWERING 4 domain-containing protein n=1 Tax=Populus tomentosa TaxID=118781 RepID=A0A8X7Y2X7_POPTO|nr:hypothetical protein POTOM_059738 [Populus tomentosa]